MTPKSKAIELVSKFRNEFKWIEKDYNVDLYRDARQCALIVVGEVIGTVFTHQNNYEYWLEVKQEIEKL